MSPDGSHYPFTARLNFDCTNNIAEYEACVMGLQAAIERNVKTLQVFSDSAVVIYQLNGEWQTHDAKLMQYGKLIAELKKEFNDISFRHLPREENQIADALATLSSMFKVNQESDVAPIQMSIYTTPVYCHSIEKENDGLPWYYDILCYIKDQQYPKQATENDKRTIRRLAMGFVLDGKILYKRGHDQVLLRCVDTPEAKKILEEVHEGIYGMHANGHQMAKQIMRASYYWLTFESIKFMLTRYMSP